MTLARARGALGVGPFGGPGVVGWACSCEAPAWGDCCCGTLVGPVGELDCTAVPVVRHAEERGTRRPDPERAMRTRGLLARLMSWYTVWMTIFTPVMSLRTSANRCTCLLLTRR